MNPGVQFPITEPHIEVEAGDLMHWLGCGPLDAGQPGKPVWRGGCNGV